jgi:sulfur-oxidizing protein SoxY
MKLVKTFAMTLALAMSYPAIATAGVAVIDGTEPGRQARWQAISEYIFGEETIEAGDHLIEIEAPARAQDPALVPITLRLLENEDIKAIHLIIDDNPSPYAAKITFGPAGDPSEINLRVRVNAYTNIHAVAETSSGKLYQTRKFVKASGGCAAPITVSDAQALEGAGQMKMKFGEGDKANRATLMIRHPNFSGMQMNQVTRHFTPARYLDKVKVSYGDHMVFEITGDISLSSDPVIGFTYEQSKAAQFAVEVSDTKGMSWEEAFMLPANTN